MLGARLLLYIHSYLYQKYKSKIVILVDGVPPKEAKGAYVVNVPGLCTDGMFPSDTKNVAAFA